MSRLDTISVRPQWSPRPHRSESRSAVRRGTRRLGLLLAVGTVALLPLAAGCRQVSGTGRSQLNAYTVSDEIRLGTEAYDEMLQGVTRITSGPEHAMVVEVTERVAAAAKRLHPEIADRFDWEVVLVDDDSVVNAWALPGGKMAVYTGILPYTRTPDGLAAVMGHEAAHAIARHGGENLTRAGLVNLVLIGASVAADEEDQVYLGAAAAAYGLLGETAFSRGQESEADELGLFIAADAGYDPREAVALWNRMAERGGEPLEFISTHPNSATRIRKLEALMPAALEIRRRRLEAGTP